VFILYKIEEAKRVTRELKQEGKRIGFVPTMGYLHDGHLSLIKKSREENDVTILSILVNPAQFGENEDLEQYPRNFGRDRVLAERAGADFIFFPAPEMMYPQGYETYVEVGNITKGLCGRTRPVHFKGVTTVVSKLFHILRPDRAYFGRKDAQQLLVIQKMVLDLNMDVEVIGCPIIRETDGLAMSSRNVYLSGAEREQALVLHRSLQTARRLIEEGERDSAVIKNKIAAAISEADLARIDYVEIVDTENMQPVDRICGGTLIALAVYFGATRLIDNCMLEVEQ
jgi:pantoate--beta-alanine ligase